MMLKICHISDWHGRQAHVPWADIYFVTGDMLRNYPKYDREYCRIQNVPWIEPHREIYKQAADVRRIKFRKYLGNPDAPVCIVGGNHDFVHLSNMFQGGPVFEFCTSGMVFEYKGLRIGGFKGVSRIAGDWSEELTNEELTARVFSLPKDINVLLTHAPPYQILDKVDRGPNVGIKAMGSYLNTQMYGFSSTLKLHCFGHIHEQFGKTVRGTEDREITFSNAATGYIMWEWFEGILTSSEQVPFACTKED